MQATPETLSKLGAGMLAGTIEKYWKARGWKVVVERYELVETFPGTWGVKSSLVGGLPRGTIFRNGALVVA